MTAIFNSLTRAAVAVGAVLALSACVTPGPAPSLMQHLDTTLRQAAPDRKVSLRLSPETITTGQALQLEVRSDQAGYLYVFQVGTDAKQLTQVFPNAIDGANFLPANTSASLPRPGWRLSARGPAGVGYLMAVVTAEPQDLMALQAQLQANTFQLKGPYAATMAPLRELAP